MRLWVKTDKIQLWILDTSMSSFCFHYFPISPLFWVYLGCLEKETNYYLWLKYHFHYFQNLVAVWLYNEIVLLFHLETLQTILNKLCWYSHTLSTWLDTMPRLLWAVRRTSVSSLVALAWEQVSLHICKCFSE